MLFRSAEKAGLLKGDIIVQLDNQKIDTFSELSGYLNTKRPNDKVQVSYLRNGKAETVSVALIKNDVIKTEFKGLELQNIDSNDKKKYKINYGVRITEVTNPNLMPYIDELKGSIILSIDNSNATDVEAVSRLLSNKDENQSVSIQMINKLGQIVRIII